jgi:outer membrane protein assembly factor BamE (lipoprotein component of BamABCDE complex)
MKIKKLYFLSVITALLSSCAKHEHFHGYSFDDKNISEIVVGQTNESELLELLGSPTVTSNFGPKTYYYISTKQVSTAFFNPSLLEQDVLEIGFNDHHRVNNIKSYTHNEARPINYARTNTELKGNEMTPLEQILSNVGKFNNPKSPRK